MFTVYDSRGIISTSRMYLTTNMYHKAFSGGNSEKGRHETVSTTTAFTLMMPMIGVRCFLETK